MKRDAMTMGGKRIRSGMLIAALAALTTAGNARADWPMYRGPAGDGVYRAQIRTNWDANPPQLLWRAQLTNGLSSVTISGGRAFTQVRRGSALGGTEHCVALSITNGAILWTAQIDTARYPDGGVGGDDGPRSTPVVKDGRVYALGSYLKLHCLDAATGANVWSKDLAAEYGGSVIPWQNAASPLIEGDLLYLNVNAGPNRLAALRLSDGSVAWRRHDERMTHATPIAVTIEGQRQVIFLTQSGLVSVNPADGNQLWRFTPIPYSTSIAITPTVESNVVYYAGAYSMGSAATRVVKSGTTFNAQQLVGRRSTREIHWSSPVIVNGHVYGLYGSTSGQLRCMNLFNNGEYTWQGPEFGTGATLLVDGKILVATEDGEIVLVEPDPAQYREITCFRATNGRIWNSPAISDGILYARATTELAAFDIGVPPPPALQVAARVDTAGGKVVFVVARSDGQPIAPDRVPRIHLRQSTSLGIPVGEWLTVSITLVQVEGGLRGELVLPAGQAAMFFCVSEDL